MRKMSTLCFNPLPHAEGDAYLRKKNPCQKGFNPLPHAEGDMKPLNPLICVKSFNPLPHAEGDADNNEWKEEWEAFQSTPSRRGRLFPVPRPPMTATFQSTPSRRGRLTELGLVGPGSLFQSTPSRRGRRCRRQKAWRMKRFQSTPSRRGRLGYEPVQVQRLCFNPLPHAEGDPVLAVNFIVCWVSIHSLTQRETFLAFLRNMA